MAYNFAHRSSGHFYWTSDLSMEQNRRIIGVLLLYSHSDISSSEPSFTDRRGK
jgi:hypothetical protein